VLEPDTERLSLGQPERVALDPPDCPPLDPSKSFAGTVTTALTTAVPVTQAHIGASIG